MWFWPLGILFWLGTAVMRCYDLAFLLGQRADRLCSSSAGLFQDDRLGDCISKGLGHLLPSLPTGGAMNTAEV